MDSGRILVPQSIVGHRRRLRQLRKGFNSGFGTFFDGKG